MAGTFVFAADLAGSFPGRGPGVGFDRTAVAAEFPPFVTAFSALVFAPDVFEDTGFDFDGAALARFAPTSLAAPRFAVFGDDVPRVADFGAGALVEDRFVAAVFGRDGDDLADFAATDLTAGFAVLALDGAGFVFDDEGAALRADAGLALTLAFTLAFALAFDVTELDVAVRDFPVALPDALPEPDLGLASLGFAELGFDVPVLAPVLAGDFFRVDAALVAAFLLGALIGLLLVPAVFPGRLPAFSAARFADERAAGAPRRAVPPLPLDEAREAPVPPERGAGFRVPLVVPVCFLARFSSWGGLR